MNYKFDIEEIKQQVASVIKYSQNFYFTDLKVDKIVEDWLEAKKFFIDKLDGNLIYQMEKPITFNLDAKSKENKFYQFINYIDNQYNNENLSRFLYSLKTEDFFNNKTSQSYDIYGIEIPENFKIIKSFKFFESDKTILKDIQNEASRIIQENCITGRLCFSVHPLDFLSASENAYNWRSCHALDGEYRSGNLNYLMDSTTVICYLKGEEEAELPHFPSEVPWNSKKWREFIILSHEGIFGIKGYPYWNPHLEEIALKWIRDLFAEQNIIYSNKVVQWQVNNEIKDPSVDSSIRINMECGPSMYNDFYEGNTYRTILAPNLKDEKITINYSGPTECIVCGQTGFLSLDGHACTDCVEHIYCHCCGEEILYDDESVRLEGEIYCRYCFDNRLPICDVCNDTLPVDEDFAPIDGIQFCVNHQDFPNVFIRDSYDSLELRTVCARCAEDVFVDGEKELHKTHGVRISWSWNNSVRSIISIQKIKDIEALSFYEDDLNVFNAEIEYLKKTE